MDLQTSILNWNIELKFQIFKCMGKLANNFIIENVE